MAEKKTLHFCEGDLPQEGDGAAITSCEESEDGTLWAANAYNWSQVAYCPYCGFQAPSIPTLLMLKRIGIGD